MPDADDLPELDPEADPAAAAEPDSPAEPLPDHGIHLERSREQGKRIAGIAEYFGGKVGLEGVLDDLKYSLRPVRVPKLRGRAVDSAWRWDAYDTRDRRWWPQGISTHGSSATGEPDHGTTAGASTGLDRILACTWYSKEVDGYSSGSRVTFVDLKARKYRHVLLVVPREGKDGVTFEPLHIHAGGIVWAGDWIHIAATAKGFYSARTDDIMRVPGEDDEGRPVDQAGIINGRICSFGHRYVLPVRYRYTARASDRASMLRYSFMSLDTESTPPSLLVGEYAVSDEATTRLARYAVDPASWLLESDDNGASRPVALSDGVKQMQGAVVARGRYYLTQSHGPFGPSWIFSGDPGDFRSHRFAAPIGAEDITYLPAEDRLWSLTEHPRRRWIYSMKRSWFDRGR